MEKVLLPSIASIVRENNNVGKKKLFPSIYELMKPAYDKDLEEMKMFFSSENEELILKKLSKTPFIDMQSINCPDEEFMQLIMAQAASSNIEISGFACSFVLRLISVFEELKETYFSNEFFGRCLETVSSPENVKAIKEILKSDNELIEAALELGLIEKLHEVFAQHVNDNAMVCNEILELLAFVAKFPEEGEEKYGADAAENIIALTNQLLDKDDVCTYSMICYYTSMINVTFPILVESGTLEKLIGFYAKNTDFLGAEKFWEMIAATMEEETAELYMQLGIIELFTVFTKECDSAKLINAAAALVTATEKAVVPLIVDPLIDQILRSYDTSVNCKESIANLFSALLPYCSRVPAIVDLLNKEDVPFPDAYLFLINTDVTPEMCKAIATLTELIQMNATNKRFDAKLSPLLESSELIDSLETITFGEGGRECDKEVATEAANLATTLLELINGE